MEDLKFIGKDKVPIVAEINTLDEFKRFVFNYSYKFDEETPDEFKQIPLASDSSTNYASYYRGHSKVEYRLESTLERHLKIFGKQFNIEKDYQAILKMMIFGHLHNIIS